MVNYLAFDLTTKMTTYGLLTFKLQDKILRAKENVIKMLSNNYFTKLAVAIDQSQVIAWDDGFASYNFKT